MDRIVKLNVGGTLFVTSESTLTWPGSDTFLATMLNGSLPSMQDESGAYFLDRDPKMFSMILNYLRTRHVGSISPLLVSFVQVRADSIGDVVSLRSEALFFGITQLVTKIDVCSDRSACGGLLFLAKLPAPMLDNASSSSSSPRCLLSFLL